MRSENQRKCSTVGDYNGVNTVNTVNTTKIKLMRAVQLLEETTLFHAASCKKRIEKAPVGPQNHMDHDSQHFSTLPKTKRRLTKPWPPLFWNHTKFETANLYKLFNRTSRTIQSIYRALLRPAPLLRLTFYPPQKHSVDPIPAMSSTSTAEGLNALPHPQDSRRFHKIPQVYLPLPSHPPPLGLRQKCFGSSAWLQLGQVLGFPLPHQPAPKAH